VIIVTAEPWHCEAMHTVILTSIRFVALAHRFRDVARIDANQWAGLRAFIDPPQDIYLIDPLGNVVLRYPVDPDIKRMAKDLERLLRASRIG